MACNEIKCFLKAFVQNAFQEIFFFFLMAGADLIKMPN